MIARLPSRAPLFPLFLAALLLAVPSYARADLPLPNPNYSSCSAVVVGNVTGAPILGGFEVQIRDGSNQPIPNSYILIEFVEGMHLAIQQNPGILVDCPTRRISFATNVDGMAAVQIRFGGSENSALIRVWSDGVFLRDIAARSLDIDGDGRVAVSDWALFQDALFHNPSSSPQMDFDQNESLGLGDFALLRDEIFAAMGMTAAGCP